MAEVGDKFLIEIADVRYRATGDGDTVAPIYYIKGFNTLVFDEYGLSKLEKPQDYEDGFKDAWNALGDIVLTKAISLREKGFE